MKNTLNLLSDTDLLAKYQSNPSDTQITEFLLSKYDYVIKTLTAKHTKKYPSTFYEDNLQNAKVAAIIAFGRFSPHSNCQPSTFIYSTVFHYLLSCNDEQSFVNCPTNLREVKSYLAGKYDTNKDKKEKFESKYKINTPQDVDDLSTYYSLLNSEAIQVMPDDILPETSCDNNIVDLVNNSLFFESLSDENKNIATLLINGYSQTKIAEILSTNNRVISPKQVYSKVNVIKEKIVQYYYG